MCELDSREFVTTELPSLWRSARGVYRFAPQSPWWTYLSGPPCLRECLIHHCGVVGLASRWLRFPESALRAASSNFRSLLVEPLPSGARAARRDRAAWTAGRGICAASPTPRPGHRSPPQHLETLIRHPSSVGRDRWEYRARWNAKSIVLGNNIFRLAGGSACGRGRSEPLERALAPQDEAGWAPSFRTPRSGDPESRGVFVYGRIPGSRLRRAPEWQKCFTPPWFSSPSRWLPRSSTPSSAFRDA